MTVQHLNVLFAGIVITAVVITVAAYLMHAFYRRASAVRAFVRTGFGGRKVVLDGGALVIPVFHEVVSINMNTLRLEVRRVRDAALITKDRMRVDVVAAFYVRVQPTREAIIRVAQTLGQRTNQITELTELLEGKFVDALRAVAAEMTMEEMHEKRGEFAVQVKALVSVDLETDGLELEAVSLTDMDQTGMEFFDPSNAFDAEGLTRLTEEIELRKKARNDIEQDTMIQIRTKNLETERRTLDIDRETEYARLEQQREVEIRRASQQAEISREKAASERNSEEARIQSHLEIEKARISEQRELDEQRIVSERDIRRLEIGRQQALDEAEMAAREEVERARVVMERAIDEAQILRERDRERLEIERRRDVEIAEHERTIAVAEKSKEVSEAQAAADSSRARAVTSEEKVLSAREVEVAERRRQIDVIQARQAAEREGVRMRMTAEAEKETAADRAEAIRMTAEGEAEADKVRALAAKLRYEIDAEGNRLMNEAQNTLTDQGSRTELRRRLIDKIEGIVRESARPLERIEGIKILQVDGLGGTAAGTDGTDARQDSFADNVVNSALRYRAQAPLVDTLLREIGITGNDLQGVSDILDSAGSGEGSSSSEEG
ncbi:MAG: flotillin family protein [Alphaproteobacteria bacterium]|nr:flotillin family protein [Alphaproteobacteria bacterium]